MCCTGRVFSFPVIQLEGCYVHYVPTDGPLDFPELLYFDFLWDRFLFAVVCGAAMVQTQCSYWSKSWILADIDISSCMTIWRRSLGLYALIISPAHSHKFQLLSTETTMCSVVYKAINAQYCSLIICITWLTWRVCTQTLQNFFPCAEANMTKPRNTS